MMDMDLQIDLHSTTSNLDQVGSLISQHASQWTAAHAGEA